MLHQNLQETHKNTKAISPIGNIIPTSQFLKQQDRLYHAEILSAMCNKIGHVYGDFGRVTIQEVYALLTDCKWECIETGHKHSLDALLTLEPIFKPNSALYRNTISNYRVVYRPHLRLGEYRITRKIPKWLLELDDDSTENEMAGAA